MTTAETPDALRYADDHRTSRQALHDLADPLSDAQFNWKPRPAAWSVAECVTHLNLVAREHLAPLEAAVADGAPRGTGPFRYGFVARKLMDAIAPDGPDVRTTTHAHLDPSTGAARSHLDKAETLAAFDSYVDRYVAVCERADGLDLARVKVRYPFMRLLRLPLGAFLTITGGHALRHVEQARRVATADAFPS